LLVTRVIGKCPRCNKENAFGNVNISQNLLLRGCTNCNYSIQIPLPDLSKSIIYLDQFFLSHAFRGNLEQFIKASETIAKLAHNQLVVCPYSPIHKTETLQWRHSQKEKLLEFIKKTSRGHEFHPDYRIRKTQITRSFKRFLKNDESTLQISIRDALPREFNNWEDYFWIDVKGFPENVDEIRKSKEDSVEQLIKLFQAWRVDNTTFKQDHQFELNDAARTYFQMYATMVQRLANDDVDALFESPIDSKVVETLLHFDEELDYQERLHRVISFFKSKYFYEVPYEFISAGLFATLKQLVKNGAYKNEQKSKKKLSGIFYDVRFISTYAPYCDAMFIDNPMIDLVKEPELNIEDKYSVKFFARKNWDEFISYLDKIKEQKNQDIEWGLSLVHP